MTAPWKATVIVSATLQNHNISSMLTAQQHRIRSSDSVEHGAFIFPLSGIAFLLLDTQDVPEHFEESGLTERINKFVFFGTNLRILPVRNNTEVVKGMLTIAKATSKPHVDSMCDRMSLAQAHVVENSPVWEMLRDIQLS
ncbi:protein SPO16 homolog isoform X2 [Solea solea]|uniref:protein SPO16 homolog isoform X2 n=1 Tax=Solea solea TaxID=90069 RepID=UPI00272A3E9C|nr:protein SPO16 homolog isoform X2 [Solea solea]